MIGQLIKTAIITTVLGGLLLISQQQALAGKWLFKPSLEGAPHIWEYQHSDSDYSHLSETAPAKPHPRNVAYSITLHNPTKVALSYTLNDQREPRIKAGESVKWVIMGSKENPAHFKIAFDNGDKKVIRYKLENDAKYHFRYTDKRLNLFKGE